VLPGPTVTGVWDVVMPDQTLKMTLNEASGSVSGTLENPGEPGTVALTGTISSGGQMTLGGTAPSDGSRVSLQVSLDASRRSFSGSITFSLAGLSVTMPVTGTKR
jgi:hypothetical protein